jgi:hypothetical protein
MSSLLEEAIVDATALKAAALKNAEAVVLEKYSTEVRGAVDALLEQEGGDPFALEEEGADGADASFLADVPYAFQNEEIDAPSEDELVEIDFSELKTRIAEEEAAGIETPEADLNDALELAEEITDTMLDNDAEEDSADLAGAADREELQEDEDVALTEEMISDLIEELVAEKVEYQGKPQPQGWASVNSADNPVEQANNDAMRAATEAHSEDEEEEDEADTAPDVVEPALYEAKITHLKESTRELRALLIESKDQLTKLNLENAKLVYQNKALSSASLNERQKDKIVEAVQSANSVEEANMIFETIQNAVGIPRSSNNRRPQTLREAVQRPVSLLLNSKKNNEATDDPKLGRMLRLAGLNK